MGRTPSLQFDHKCKPNPEYRPLRNLLIWVLFFTVVLALVWWLYPDGAEAGEPQEGTQAAQDAPGEAFATREQVEAWIYHFLRGVKKGKRWKGAQELSGLIVEHAAAPEPIVERYWEKGKRIEQVVELQPIDPLLVAVNFSLESSFYRTIKGKAGELGLPQINPGNKRAMFRADGTPYDMEKRSDQVEAGVRELAYCVQHCGSLEEGFTKYKYGGCKPVKGVGPYRTKVYRRARRIVGLDPIE